MSQVLADSAVLQVTGRGIPLSGNDIDTDRIIPARFLRCVTFDGLGSQVFADDRQQTEGQHPFDQAVYQGATILVVNGNFGCGSSREHAPQALSKWGIQALVGESFAEIFFGNCVAIGIPCVTADPSVVKDLQMAIAADPAIAVTLDLNALQVYWEDQQAPVAMNSGSRQMLVSGTWDATGQLVAQMERIQSVARELAYFHW